MDERTWEQDREWDGYDQAKADIAMEHEYGLEAAEPLTKTEYAALVKVWRQSPTCQPGGVSLVTLYNLVHKGLLESEWSTAGEITVFWLTDAGKRAMDVSMQIYGAMP